MSDTRDVTTEQSRVLLLLCTAEDTVQWCRLAEAYAASVIDGLQVVYGAPGDSFPGALENWQGDWIISFRGDMIVPERIFSRATQAAVNIHPSPPHFRGLGGQHYAVYDGHQTYGSTCHHMAASVDAGEIIDVVTFPIARGCTTSALRHHVGAHSLAQFYDLVARHVAGDEPLPRAKETWGEVLYTSKALSRWIADKQAAEPNHPCLR